MSMLYNIYIYICIHTCIYMYIFTLVKVVNCVGEGRGGEGGYYNLSHLKQFDFEPQRWFFLVHSLRSGFGAPAASGGSGFGSLGLGGGPINDPTKNPFGAGSVATRMWRMLGCFLSTARHYHHSWASSSVALSLPPHPDSVFSSLCPLSPSASTCYHRYVPLLLLPVG